MPAFGAHPFNQYPYYVQGRINNEYDNFCKKCAPPIRDLIRRERLCDAYDCDTDGRRVTSAKTFYPRKKMCVKKAICGSFEDNRKWILQVNWRSRHRRCGAGGFPTHVKVNCKAEYVIANGAGVRAAFCG